MSLRHPVQYPSRKANWQQNTNVRNRGRKFKSVPKCLKKHPAGPGQNLTHGGAIRVVEVRLYIFESRIKMWGGEGGWEFFFREGKRLRTWALATQFAELARASSFLPWKKTRALQTQFAEPASSHTGWRRCIGCLKLQVSFRKRVADYRALLRKMTYKDKASYASSPSCSHTHTTHTHTHVCMYVFEFCGKIHTFICVCVCGVCVAMGGRGPCELTLKCRIFFMRGCRLASSRVRIRTRIEFACELSVCAVSLKRKEREEVNHRRKDVGGEKGGRCVFAWKREIERVCDCVSEKE